jgi:hypothetical protein
MYIRVIFIGGTGYLNVLRLIWCVSCSVVVLTCFVMCGCMYVGVW